jgi:hypothetical protein
MAGAELRNLFNPTNRLTGQGMFDLISTMTMNHIDLFGMKRQGGCHNMTK